MKFSNVIEFFFLSSFGAFICERRSRLTFSGHILESLRSLDYCIIYQKYMPLHTNCSCFLISIAVYCMCVTSVFASDLCERCAMNVRRLSKSYFSFYVGVVLCIFIYCRYKLRSQPENHVSNRFGRRVIRIGAAKLN